MDLLASRLEDEEDDAGIRESLLDDPLTYLSEERTCQGQFEDCVSWEPDQSILDVLFRSSKDASELSKIPLKHEQVNIQSSKTIQPSLSGVSRIDSTPIEQISRRVFAPTIPSFVPKLAISKEIASNTLKNPSELKCSSNEQIVDKDNSDSSSSFRTARDELHIQNIKVIFQFNTLCSR